MIWKALCPAKINTFLAVGPPDSRGWHPLRTVFCAVSLADRLQVELGSSSPGVFCDWPGLPPENTLTKTLRLVSEAVEIPPLRIELTKGIPSQSGLGGGSSDAAGLLRLLARWMPEAFPDYYLQEVAASVGSDVPFFLHGGLARGSRYGDAIEELPDGEPRWLVIAQPSQGTPTPEAYRALDSAPREWRDWPESPWELYNDFERVAGCGSLELIERLLTLGCPQAGLTGSGSAVFGWAEDAEEAIRVAEVLREEGAPFTASCRTLNREESLWIS